MSQESPAVAVGATVDTEDGDALGTVRGFDTDGFFVTTRGGIASLSVEHERAGHALGEAELLWRCGDRGKMGDLDDGVPDAWPSCDASKEHRYYWTGD